MKDHSLVMDMGKPSNVYIEQELNPLQHPTLCFFLCKELIIYVHLPVSGFQSVENIKENILNLSNNSKTGYIFEVNLEYPQELHDVQKDLSFCTEYMKKPPSTFKHTTLLTTLLDKIIL